MLCFPAIRAEATHQIAAITLHRVADSSLSARMVASAKEAPQKPIIGTGVEVPISRQIQFLLASLTALALQSVSRAVDVAQVYLKDQVTYTGGMGIIEGPVDWKREEGHQVKGRTEGLQAQLTHALVAELCT